MSSRPEPTADRPDAPHPLTSYLRRLMALKKSNLCLSADVTSSTTLLHLAASLGPSIVVLKTHADIVSDWDPHAQYGTGQQLALLARRHGFLIFEDRKFGDIGSTVQRQYAGGVARIVEWAHITNAHILPGEGIVRGLREAKERWRERKRCEVRTEVWTGTPRAESVEGGESEEGGGGARGLGEVAMVNGGKGEGEGGREDGGEGEGTLQAYKTCSVGRKGSIVSITTVSQHFESADSRPKPLKLPEEATDDDDDDDVFAGIEEAPLERGLLLLAQMSSAGNFLDRAYTEACIDIARRNTDFVMGFICQESLNARASDHFVHMTPGCQLPPEADADEEVAAAAQTNGINGIGDSLGQQYNTPRKIITEKGSDLIIVGRGIISASDPATEAERYRIHGWEAYEDRLKKKSG